MTLALTATDLEMSPHACRLRFVSGYVAYWYFFSMKDLTGPSFRGGEQQGNSSQEAGKVYYFVFSLSRRQQGRKVQGLIPSSLDNSFISGGVRGESGER